MSNIISQSSFTTVSHQGTNYQNVDNDGTELEVRAIKVILLGDQSVGKTSLRSQYVHHYFSNNYKATIGADFLSYKVRTSSNQPVNLQIWDTAGQERFNAVSKAFYRGSDIAILVYDITNSESFHNLSKWLENFLKYCNSSAPNVIIVGNKSDNQTIRQLSFRQAVEFAGQLDPGLITDLKYDVLEVTAKNYLDVEKIFKRCAELGLVKSRERREFVGLDFEGVVDVANPENRDGKKWFRCC